MAIRYAKPDPVPITERTWIDKKIDRCPIWNAVDLRDGNQALPNPMTPQQKRDYFKLLCDIGFKEIEVGFPAASQDDFQFVRDLIEQKLIPDDVTISVLTQARDALIERTMVSLQGVKKAVVHFYIATSELHHRFVFGLERPGMIQTVAHTAELIRTRARAMAGSKIGLEFSPEEFTDTDLAFAVEICDAAVAAWHPAPGEKVVLNLPATVERRMPTEYADLIEEFKRRQAYPESTLISLHPHNDMGMGVAATMLALQAGADRVEGTLFGHGERTGNVDLVTVALNLEYLGIDTGLDFSDLPNIRKIVEKVTDIPTHVRHPYAGDLVFTAFSGSHQDAIRKGLARKDELAAHFGGWKVPYLHVDPSTIGRRFDRFIRINSQSGKGGIAHVLETEYNVRMPRWVQIDLARHVQAYADSEARELSAEEVWQIFHEQYKIRDTPLRLLRYWPRPSDEDPSEIEGEAHVELNGQTLVLKDTGNGPISAFVHALRKVDGLPGFVLDEYDEETRGHSADAEAVCYVRLKSKDSDKSRIGVGIASNIDQAAVRAVTHALNALCR